MILKVISIFICGLIIVAVWQHKRRRLHIAMLLSAFLLDLGLVLYIELTREAVQTAVSKPHPFVMFHILISVGCILANAVQISSGVNYIRSGNGRAFHRLMAKTFLILRVSNLVTSFGLHHFKEPSVVTAKAEQSTQWRK